jgi:hypothetical protein
VGSSIVVVVNLIVAVVVVVVLVEVVLVVVNLIVHMIACHPLKGVIERVVRTRSGKGMVSDRGLTQRDHMLNGVGTYSRQCVLESCCCNLCVAGSDCICD